MGLQRVRHDWVTNTEHVIKCVLQIILFGIIGAYHYIMEKSFFHFSASRWDGMSLHIDKMVGWSQDILYKKPMYSLMLFLGAGGGRLKSKINLRESCPPFKRVVLKEHTIQMAIGFCSLIKSGQTPETDRKKEGHLLGWVREGKLAAAGEKDGPVWKYQLPTPAPLPPVTGSCAVLRQCHGLQLREDHWSSQR